MGQWSNVTARRVDWVGDNIRCSLHSASYAVDQDAHIFFSAATNEISAGNYSLQTLGTKSVTLDTATNTVALIAANTTFANLTNTFRYAVIWKDTGSPATSPLLGYVDLGARSTTAQDFVIDWNDTLGVLKMVAT